jgi:UPF0042 nucleotide-binding protein
MSELSKTGLVIIVSGLSGSGKSSALNAFEDNGFLAIDNLPSQLLSKFLAIRKESGDYIKIAVGMDAREEELIEHFVESFQQVRDLGFELKILFLDADSQSLVKRFSETRRPHPLGAIGGLTHAIELERSRMAPLKDAADVIIDTSTLSSAQLRTIILERFVQVLNSRHLAVEVLSFGFKNGIPPEADLMVDVRFLPNPFYISQLRALDGRDQKVRDFVMSHQEACIFLEKLLDLLIFVLPWYQNEGKSYLTIAIGCTGGQHRSVALAINLFESLKQSFPGNLMLRHRDIK